MAIKTINGIRYREEDIETWRPLLDKSEPEAVTETEETEEINPGEAGAEDVEGVESVESETETEAEAEDDAEPVVVKAKTPRNKAVKPANK